MWKQNRNKSEIQSCIHLVPRVSFLLLLLALVLGHIPHPSFAQSLCEELMRTHYNENSEARELLHSLWPKNLRFLHSELSHGNYDDHMEALQQIALEELKQWLMPHLQDKLDRLVASVHHVESVPVGLDAKTSPRLAFTEIIKLYRQDRNRLYQELGRELEENNKEEALKHALVVPKEFIRVPAARTVELLEDAHYKLTAEQRPWYEKDRLINALIPLAFRTRFEQKRLAQASMLQWRYLNLIPVAYRERIFSELSRERKLRLDLAESEEQKQAINEFFDNMHEFMNQAFRLPLREFVLAQLLHVPWQTEAAHEYVDKFINLTILAGPYILWQLLH